MIRYSLRCDRNHAFESWFRDSQAFDDQNRSGLVACPDCGSTKVVKGLMAPAVVASRSKRGAAPLPAPSSPEQVPVALLDEKAQKFRALMREVRDHVMKNTHDVGASFPEEARKMHDGVVEQRAIRGEASAAEVKALIEDGIEVMPVPSLPDERN